MSLAGSEKYRIEEAQRLEKRVCWLAHCMLDCTHKGSWPTCLECMELSHTTLFLLRVERATMHWVQLSRCLLSCLLQQQPFVQTLASPDLVPPTSSHCSLCP